MVTPALFRIASDHAKRAGTPAQPCRPQHLLSRQQRTLMAATTGNLDSRDNPPREAEVFNWTDF